MKHIVADERPIDKLEAKILRLSIYRVQSCRLKRLPTL